MQILMADYARPDSFIKGNGGIRTKGEVSNGLSPSCTDADRVAHLFKLYASHAPKSLSSHCCVA